MLYNSSFKYHEDANFTFLDWHDLIHLKDNLFNNFPGIRGHVSVILAENAV
jgi:hypothetical protein